MLERMRGGQQHETQPGWAIRQWDLLLSGLFEAWGLGFREDPNNDKQRRL